MICDVLPLATIRNQILLLTDSTGYDNDDQNLKFLSFYRDFPLLTIYLRSALRSEPKYLLFYLELCF